MKQCKKCKFYPNDCDYWKKNLFAGYVNENTNHNCPDYKKREEIKK